MGELAISFVTLLALEIILGIDNVIFIAILSNKLPTKSEQDRARQLGIAMAVISRLLLLGLLFFLIDGDSATNSLFEVFGRGISIKDIILLVGGAFLIGKSTYEIHEKLEGHEGGHGTSKSATTLRSILIQVMIIDVVFSLDSVITAVGVAENIWVMITAILISAAIMVFASGTIADFVERHPTFKILALAFLILIGSLLVAEGWLEEEVAKDLHLKNYVYFAMAFSVIVEVINMQLRKQSNPLKLKGPADSDLAAETAGNTKGKRTKPKRKK